VTRYAAAVAERSASELRFRALIDSAVDAIIEFDEQGRIERVNPAVEKLFGYSPAELLGQSVNVLVAASDLVPGGRQLLGGAVGALGVLGAGRVISARRKDGSTFPAELAVSEFLIEGKRHFTSINRDISERERYVVELGQFKRTLDHTHDCILIFDPDTLRFSYANRGAVTHTGYSVEELLRMTPLDLNTSFDEAHFRELIAPLRLGAQEVVVFESIHRRKSGTEIPVEVMIQYLAPAGEMSRFVNIIRDISERKQNERMKSEFVSTVSHELRTPLTSIRGSLGLLSAGVTGELPATAKEYVDIALSNSDRLVRLINDILDLEKMHAGGIELRLKVVDLHTLLRNALVANHSLVAAPRATIALVGAVPDARVRVDEDRILQVLTNLIANAVKFSPPGQQVEVSVTLRDRWVRVSVRDHGCGIPEEFRGRIFQRFAQADSGEVRKGGGTGLGLSICKAIIEAMAGSIGFESAPGGGTIFYFELPLAPEMADADGGAGHGSHELLLCGTGLEVADHIARMVERSGARVHVAPVLPCAQQVIAARRYHVVALESALPDAADPALPSQLDLVGDEQSDPVVIIAGSGAGPVLGRFASAAMLVADIVPKPVDEERLLRAIWTTGDPVGAGWVVRVLHITADRVLRRIVERLLPAEWDVAGAATCGDARARLTSSRFDLVLLDLTLPGAAPRLLASVGSAQLVLVAADEPSAGLVRRLARILVDGRLQERRCRDAVVALLGARARAERYA
jgi:PAS domain S-box-containing protein